MVGTGNWKQRLQLASGLVLFVFVTTHFLNHALGLVSLEVMEQGRLWFLAVWRNPLGTFLLFAALIVHPVLTMAKLFRGRGCRLPLWQAVQLLVGLAIPFLLAAHILATRALMLRNRS